ncbi:MAG: zinc ABC transporter substrate-binding protein, partial [Patescibacteria group bacterium]|nr:zinc ABC transporter substrate-binding protein [Patescibacteria group bacterium]
MSKKLLYFAVVILAVVGVVFFISKRSFQQNQTVNDNKLQVITTLYPLYDFVKNVGQDKAEVTLLLPPGVEPHAFEPKPNDVMAINQADVFVYTGKFMEVWAEDILKGVTNKDLKAVDTSEGIKLILSEFHDEDEPAGSSDPHIWLDFNNAQVMVDNITQGLIEKDPINKDFYLANAVSYKKKLQELDEQYKTILNTCKIKDVVYGGHYAFGYLTKRYGLNYVAAQGIAPDSEPTANDM